MTLLKLTTTFVCAAIFSISGQTVLYNHDFKTGNAGTATATGGTWNGGWTQKGSTGAPRILFVAPANLKSGSAEVKMTVTDPYSTSAMSTDKNIYFSIYKAASLAQRDPLANYAYVRVRRDRSYFIEFKARVPSVPNESEGEVRIGVGPDWTKWLNKEFTMKYTWSAASAVTLYHPNNSGSGHSTTPCARGHKITDIKYVCLGADGSYGARVDFFKYLSLKVTTGDAVGAVSKEQFRTVFTDQGIVIYSASDKSLYTEVPGSYELQVTNAKGSAVYNGYHVDQHRVALPELTSGIYFARAKGAASEHRTPFIVRR